MTTYKPVDPDLAYCEAGDHWTLAHGKGGEDWHFDDSGDYCCECWVFINDWRGRTWGNEPRAERVAANARALSYTVVCEHCGVAVDEGSEDEPVPYRDPHPYMGPHWHANDPDAPEPPEFYDGMLLCPACMDKTPRCGCRECDPD